MTKHLSYRKINTLLATIGNIQHSEPYRSNLLALCSGNHNQFAKAIEAVQMKVNGIQNQLPLTVKPNNKIADKMYDLAKHFRFLKCEKQANEFLRMSKLMTEKLPSTLSAPSLPQTITGPSLPRPVSDPVISSKLTR